MQAAIIETLAPAYPAILQKAEISALAPPDGAIGRYRVIMRNQNAFVRVSARIGAPDLEQSITGWLRDRGLAVNHLDLAGLRLTYAGQSLRVDVRELLEGRHHDRSIQDLCRVAEALAKCHALLRAFPQAALIRERAAKRYQRLATVSQLISEALDRGNWEVICSAPRWAEANERWLRAMTKSYKPRFDLMPAAQCLHAQVHRGNVVFCQGSPVLLDFEEAVQTFAPVAWDLAYFVQRFCMAEEGSVGMLTERMSAVREAYGHSVPGLAEMMRQTAWFSMAVLVDYHLHGIFSPSAEFEKFVRLEQGAADHAEIIGRHFDV